MKNWQNIIFATPNSFTEKTGVNDIPSWRTVASKLKLSPSESSLCDSDDDHHNPSLSLVVVAQQHIKLWYGDLTKLQADTIVNAANPTLRSGGGVCGALHRAAGRKLEEACLKLLSSSETSSPEVGEVFITPGFDLPCRSVVHVISPSRASDENTIRKCYRNILSAVFTTTTTTATYEQVQDRDHHDDDETTTTATTSSHGSSRRRSIGFCSLGTGSHMIPVEVGARIAVEEICNFLVKRQLQDDNKSDPCPDIVFCCYDEDTLEAYKNALVNVLGK